jgi:hypothetical protein
MEENNSTNVAGSTTALIIVYHRDNELLTEVVQ